MTTEKPAAALSTSDGARCYIAHFFAREMGRHDFATYIATDLAADFACALAQHLAARQSGAKVPVMFADVELSQAQSAEFLLAGANCNTGLWPSVRRKYVVPLYLDPPAQGIDLAHQQDAARWRWVREQCGVTVSVEEADDDGDMAFVSGHTPEELDVAIDGQRDAAPGVDRG